jgi:RNA polymerase sigma-70 factor (ECF subfamily)
LLAIFKHASEKGKVTTRPLSVAFRTLARVSAVEDDVLEAELDAAVQRAAEAWPGLRLEAEAFVRYVAARWQPAADPAAALRALHAPDLALAHACVRGDRLALQLLDRQFLSRTGEYVAKLATRVQDLDEVRQRLRERLLVGKPGQPPRLAAYRGQGPLGAWLRTAAVRAAVDLARERTPHPGGDDGVLDRLASLDDPELAHVRKLYGRELKDAFQAAIGELPSRDASLLKLHFIEGMRAADVGRLYRVNARTVQRWIADARAGVLASTRTRLKKKLGLSSSQLHSVLRLAASQFDASVRRLLSRR